MKVFLTGASGFIGREIAEALIRRGDTVLGLTRNPAARLPKGVEAVVGDPTVRGPWSTRVSGCDAIVHLAGETIGGRRWNAAQKERILMSRVVGTRAMVTAIETSPADLRPRTLLHASGSDYYPFDESERPYGEDAPPGDTFLAKVCVAWEAEAQAARVRGTRVVAMRTGVVFGKGGEALQRMAQPFRMGVGGPVGSGRQWFSWVHLADVAGAYLLALDSPGVSGAVNVVAPGAVRQKALAAALGKALRRPSWAPVPGVALRVVVGGMAEYLLHGRRMAPAALEKAGYVFRAQDVATALAASL